MIDRTWNRMRVSTPIEKRGWGWEPYDPRKPLDTHSYPPQPRRRTWGAGVQRGRVRGEATQHKLGVHLGMR